MWKNSWGVCIDKSVDILKYARLVKHSIDYTYMQGLKYIVIAGQTEKLQIQVAEHINIEWILQSNEYDIFC